MSVIAQPAITLFFLHQDMARAVCGAALSPSVSLSIALVVKYMRIIRAVKKAFPPFPCRETQLALCLLMCWFSWDPYWLAALTHLACISRIYPSRRAGSAAGRGQRCWVLRLCLSWDSWEGSLRQVSESLQQLVASQRHVLVSSYTFCTSCTCSPSLPPPFSTSSDAGGCHWIPARW